jgi:deoxyribodipyrimidine photo-lyase
MTDFPPNRQTALERTDAIDPARYARTCNHLDGAVSRLSPYLTHGVVSVPEVIARLATRGIRPDDRIVMELAWREYWQHAWRHLGKAIFDGRNQYDDARCREFGLDVFPVGVPSALERR